MTLRFDWMRFLGEYNIPFVEKGANVGRGNVNIVCPFCVDPSEHMGVSLTTSKWGCWRCNKGGTYPGPLLCRLLNTTSSAAEQIIEGHQESNPDAFESLFEQQRDVMRAQSRIEIRLPTNFKPMWHSRSAAARYLDYLAVDRGFAEHAQAVALRYQLHYAMTGPYSYRIIMPVYHSARLVSYVGRTIGDAKPRYKTEGDSVLKTCIANHDWLMRPWQSKDTLLITEGPFDFMKMDFVGRTLGMHATCTFGTAFNKEQVALLAKLLRQRFTRGLVLFDNEARAEGLGLADQLSELCGKSVLSVTCGQAGFDSDPGGLSLADAHALIRNLQERLGVLA